MCSWNKIINTLKHGRGNINPFTTFEPTGWKWLKKLELLSATPRATLTHLSCSPNFPCASYLDERKLTYEPIVNWLYLLSKWMASLHSKGLMTHTYIKISTASFFNPSGQILLNKMSIGVIFHRVLSINNKSNKNPGAIKINCKSNI